MHNKYLLQKLSEKQIEAIEEPSNVLLIAIPGSGKTRTLTNKILYEYDENDSRLIVAITYTNRAVDEMRERIFNQLGTIPNNIWIGTIHKFCLDFVIRKYSRFSETLSRPFTIIGEKDSKDLKEKLLTKYGLKNDNYIDYTLDVFGKVKEKYNPSYVEEYYKELLDMRMIDFNYILYETYKILNNNNMISNQLASLISVLCIDEYQDTQELQYQILSLICKKRKKIKIFIVGDPNQAIYTSMGGVVKSKTELKSLFETTFTQKQLDCCFRSHQDVIDFYRRFALYDFDMKSGVADYKNPEISIIDTLHKDDLVSKVRDLIIDLNNEGIQDEEICILAPQWTYLYNFSNQLRRELPNNKFDAPSVLPLKKDENNVIYKLCKLLLTKYSFVNKTRILFIVGEIRKQLSDEYCINPGIDNYEFLKLILNSKTCDVIGTDYLKNSLYNFFNLLGVINIFQSKIDEFMEETESRIDTYEKFGLEDDRLALERTLRSKEGIVISTAHSVKGEEYRAVIAFGLLEGLIPHWQSINCGTAREDSKRLLFVICSRAKEKLFLIAEQGRSNFFDQEYEINEDIKEILNAGY